MDNGDIGERIGKLLEDPQALSQIMSIAGGLMGGMEMQGDAGNAPSKEDAVQTSVNTAPSLGGIEAALPTIMGMMSKGNKNDPRCNLLTALKPYMSRERSEKIDMLIKLLRLADLAGGFLGSGILGGGKS